MTTDWAAVYSKIPIIGERVPSATTAAHCDEWEAQHQLQLPRSYREFVLYLGAGRLSDEFEISAPGLTSSWARPYFLDAMNSTYHGRDEELPHYVDDPAQFLRSIFFAMHVTTFGFAWDPLDKSDADPGEVGIYVWDRDRDYFNLVRIAHSFGEFIQIILSPTRYQEVFRRFWQGRSPEPSFAQYRDRSGWKR
jgi:hypothetical protein